MFAVSLRAVFRGARQQSDARRKVHWVRLHTKHASLRDVRVGLSIPSVNAALYHSLGTTEQEGSTGVEGASKQRQSEAV